MGVDRRSAGPSFGIKLAAGLVFIGFGRYNSRTWYDAAGNYCLPLTIFRYDAFEELCYYDNYYDPPLMAGPV